MADSVNMSLDDIIKQNRVSRIRGRGRGIGRGRGRGRGRGGVNHGNSQSRANTPGPRQGRSRSRGPRGASQPRGRSQSRSRSRQRFNSNPRTRSASRSRSQRQALTPKGRAGLEDQQAMMPQLLRNNRFSNRGQRNGLRRSNSNPNLHNNVHSRLGINTRRGGFNTQKQFAVSKRGISKRGRGLVTGNRYSAIGLRSDQLLKEQRHHLLTRSNVIKSQTFTRSRNSLNQLTVSVANDFAKRRRNSVGSTGYLNKQALAQLTSQFGGYNTRRGPGSVKSLGSNKSNRSNGSNNSKGFRGRGRGRGRGVSRNFVNKQILNPKLQREIAAIQGKDYTGVAEGQEAPSGVNFSPTPAATTRSLHQRFASM